MKRKKLTIVVASRNDGKVREIERIFRNIEPDVDWCFVSAKEINLPEVEETGKTFLENARIKAVSSAEHTGMICLGEDSGLEVDALSGAPGVMSHRFSQSGSDEDNNALLLKLLKGTPLGLRKARYKCALVIACPREILVEGEGSVEGLILNELRGQRGFGYDPLFYSIELGKTFGEASDAEKDRVSHRRRAIEKVIPAIKRYKNFFKKDPEF